MLVTLAGAMSTAELGISLAEMIRQDKVHAISCTGANLEEDIFNLVAHEDYVRIPNWRELSHDEEMELLDKHLNRVTDTCIPGRTSHSPHRKARFRPNGSGRTARTNPTSHMNSSIRSLPTERLEKSHQIDPKNSWMLAACEKNLPIFVPGWEDSTLGNIFAGRLMQGEINKDLLEIGVEYMVELANWYIKSENPQGIGFFQIGGGIAGDFPICVVPMLSKISNVNTAKWSVLLPNQRLDHLLWFLLGRRPNEKITWGKLDKTSKSLSSSPTLRSWHH